MNTVHITHKRILQLLCISKIVTIVTALKFITIHIEKNFHAFKDRILLWEYICIVKCMFFRSHHIPATIDPVWMPHFIIMVLGRMSGRTTIPLAAWRSKAIRQISLACLQNVKLIFLQEFASNDLLHFCTQSIAKKDSESLHKWLVRA